MEPLSVNGMVAGARTRMKSLSIEELPGEREKGDTLLVDIRAVREHWREGTI